MAFTPTCEDLSNGERECTLDIGRKVISNGTSQYAFYCTVCSAPFAWPGKHRGNYLSKETVAQLLGCQVGEIESQVPICGVAQGKPCSVKGCVTTETELHHWAPKALFGDAEDWPQTFLCRTHHKRWHDTMDNPLSPVSKDFAVSKDLFPYLERQT